MEQIARKISAYNRHVGREMKAGKTMKQAAASWKRKGSTTKKRRRTSVPKKKKSKRRGRKLIGNIGLKGAILGGLTYFGVSRVMPNVGGPYAPAVTKVATGLVAKSVGVPGAMMAGAGLIEAVAIGIEQLMTGGLALPFMGGGGTQGGYDY